MPARTDCLAEFEAMKVCFQENADYYQDEEEDADKEPKQIGQPGWSFD